MNLLELKQHAIEAMGFDRLNAMQETMLDKTVSGSDMLLLSPTGTGKTMAFLLPLVALAQTGKLQKALVLVPSRELAMQIADVFKRLKTGLRAVCCYGGHDIRLEQQDLNSKPEFTILIGTPGRIKDHMERGSFAPEQISHLVLDEYDKSLELGFEDEMRTIVEQLPNLVQRILTSATHAMPIANYLGIKRFEKVDFLPAKAEAKSSKKSADDASTDAKYALSDHLTLRQVKSPIADKLDTLLRLLGALDDDAQIIVFSNYRESSERIAHFLSENGIDNALYHGGLEQDIREKALIRFRGGSIRVLVSTDLASRGLDIPEVEHIIHYHLPTSEEAFTHRNGRTARAGARGTAYIILGPTEYLPAYISPEPTFFNLPASDRAFHPTPWETVYIGRGKREKISKGDVLGFFTKNGGIDGSQIGRIDILEHCAYVAIKRDVVAGVIEKVKGQKIKGEKTHYLIVRGC